MCTFSIVAAYVGKSHEYDRDRDISKKRKKKEKEKKIKKLGLTIPPQKAVS